ncbi:MAG: aspartate carbamoyltransferase regulatory subunit [Gammaproteobacteria bacterium]|nr:aspartate carbamoyltransferase regulatory subunit [Gammaproteobacteria bacterium]
MNNVTNKTDNKIKMIVNGVVIDHILNNNLLKILQLLHWQNITDPVAVGFNLTSKRLGKKALIKMNNAKFTDEQKNIVALFAKGATYNIIAEGEVISKETLIPQNEAEYDIYCPNTRCVSRMYKSVFIPKIENDTVRAECKYCELHFSLDELREFRND